jgi:CspA family cold shock protein
MRQPERGSARHSRGRGFGSDMPFDDPGFGSRSAARPGTRPPAAPAGPETSATVKWFNPDKGFGFVQMTDGTGDVFLHASVLARLGLTSINPGATLRVRVSEGQRGRQVAEVVSVDQSTAQPNSGFAPKPRRTDPSTAVPATGVVKWYNATKGFGFVSANDGGKDIFVHASVLERSGVGSLAEGQAVSMQVVQGAKGPEAISIQVA